MLAAVIVDIVTLSFMLTCTEATALAVELVNNREDTLLTIILEVDAEVFEATTALFASPTLITAVALPVVAAISTVRSLLDCTASSKDIYHSQ